MKILLKSVRETKKYAARLAREIMKRGPAKSGATVMGLVGDLGAGKTTFAQGFGKALGIKKRFVSPTFLIFRRYSLPRIPARHDAFRSLYHVDAYRLKSIQELHILEFNDIIRNPENIVLIEWADKIKKVLPKTAIWVTLSHGINMHEREISR